MSSVEPMTHICSKQLVTLSPKVFFLVFQAYVTRLRFRHVTPWILARFHDKNNDISSTSLP